MDWYRVLLDILFPPRHEEVLVAEQTSTTVRALVAIENSVKGWSLVSYTDPRIRALVWEAKYHQNPHALALIGTALTEALTLNFPMATHYVPIPLSTRRERERGYNQVALALRSSTLHTSGVILEHVLHRTRETVPQTQLARKQRLTNVVGCFSVAADAPPDLRGAHIVVIDDVITTGATLSEARLALLRAGAAKVDVLAFARS